MKSSLTRRLITKLLWLLLLVVMPPVIFATPEGVPVHNSKTGFEETILPSEFQASPARVEILLPSKFDKAKQYPVLYILPVDGRHEFGDGLAEAKKDGLADKYNLICVSPSFTKVPWYGNHASDLTIRQEDYLLHSVIPFIDRSYPTQQNAEGRWLIGFSKSGWGAYTLLFRHPDIFGYAAAWDVPFMRDGDHSGKDWGPMGIRTVFGTNENFQGYLPTRLATEKAPELKQRCRLVLGLGAFWKPQVEQMHALLERLRIPHIYRTEFTVPHRWDTGWFSPLAEDLVKIARAPSTQTSQRGRQPDGYISL